MKKIRDWPNSNCLVCGGSGRYESSFDGHRADYDLCTKGCPQMRNNWTDKNCVSCGAKKPNTIWWPQDGSGPFCKTCIKKK